MNMSSKVHWVTNPYHDLFEVFLDMVAERLNIDIAIEQGTEFYKVTLSKPGVEIKCDIHVPTADWNFAFAMDELCRANQELNRLKPTPKEVTP